MKIHPDSMTAQSITAHGPGWVQVGSDKFSSSVVVVSDGRRMLWNCVCFEDLSRSHFEQWAALECELVIFGSGQRMRFAPPALTQPLMERHIGLECMDTPAACRTYNILVQEGRRIAVALLIEPVRIATLA